MGIKKEAGKVIAAQFAALSGVPEGAEAIGLGDIETRAIDLLFNLATNCLGSFSSREVAEAFVEPTQFQKQLFSRVVKKEARKAVRKSRDLRGKALKSAREEYAANLELAMLSSAQTAGVDQVEELVDAMRGES